MAQTKSDDRIVRLDEVCRMTGLKKTWLYHLEREGNFPRRRKLSARAVGWRHSEIMDWIRSRPEVPETGEAA